MSTKNDCLKKIARALGAECDHTDETVCETLDKIGDVIPKVLGGRDLFNINSVQEDEADIIWNLNHFTKEIHLDGSATYRKEVSVDEIEGKKIYIYDDSYDGTQTHSLDIILNIKGEKFTKPTYICMSVYGFNESKRNGMKIQMSEGTFINEAFMYPFYYEYNYEDGTYTIKNYLYQLMKSDINKYQHTLFLGVNHIYNVVASYDPEY